MKHSSSRYKILFVSLFSCLANLNPALFGIVVASLLIGLVNKFKFKKIEFFLFCLSIFRIIWLLLIASISPVVDWSYFLAEVVSSIFIIFFLFIKVSGPQVKNFFFVVYIFFMIDLMFNLSIVLTGNYFSITSVALRPGDFLMRLPGVFGHPFISVQLGVLAFIAGYVLDNKKIIFLASIGLLLNGTLKSPLAFFVLFCLVLLLKNFKGVRYIYLFALISWGGILWLTYLNSDVDGFISGNDLRVIAWRETILYVREFIFWPRMEFPVFEGKSLMALPYSMQESQTLKNIIYYGISESPYFQSWVYYGILGFILNIVIFSLVVYQCYHRSKSDPTDSILFSGLVLASYVLVNYMYGTFFGTILTSCAFCVLCISHHPKGSDISSSSNARRAFTKWK